jgi:hypothetical protein
VRPVNSAAGRSFIEPGSPWQNPFVESFGSRVRDEVLSVEAFDSVLEAQTVITDWRTIYNHRRPHSSLGWRTPAAFATTVTGRSPALPTPALIAAAGPTKGAGHLIEGVRRYTLLAVVPDRRNVEARRGPDDHIDNENKEAAQRQAA